MRNRISNSIWGILFILVGIGIAGNVMGLWAALKGKLL